MTTAEPPEPPQPQEPSLRQGWRRDLPFRWELGAYGVLFILGLIMRLWDLGIRAVHHDESLHGVFSFDLYQGDGYIHNPLMHGPFLFHGTAGSFMLFGDSDFALRLLPALFGAALILLPLLLRHRLGNLGALATAVILTFSPSLLYFSRFARNDIFMAVWTLGLVAVMWRYLDEQKPRYLYIGAALIALGFATKETQFIVVGLLGLALLVLARSDVGKWLWGHRSLREFGPAGSVLILIGALTLPMIGASAAIFQDALGLTLAAKEGTPNLATGEPAPGTATMVAGAVVGTLLTISVVVGLRWNWRQWLKVLGVFWFIFALLFTTVGTNPGGFGTGVWQSLGYWIGQQEVARGNQPWYYYFIVVSVYEFLPWVIAIGASGYYILKGDRFTRFLVFWAVATFIAYTIASEKMPWLLVNITLPLAVLAGKAIGDAMAAIKWREVTRRGGLFVYAGLPLLLIITWRVIYFDGTPGSIKAITELWSLLLVIAALLIGFYVLTKRIGRKPAWSVALSAFVLLLLGLTIRSGWIATYKHGDIPKEMLVYTQTAPDIRKLAREIEDTAELMGRRAELPVTIDSTDGFTWPWAWYLRNYENVGYPSFKDGGPASSDDTVVAVVNEKNSLEAGKTYGDQFTDGRKIVHRWWFPEDYRGLTPGGFFGSVVNPTEWRTAVDYFFYRELPSPIGGVDSYVYFRDDVPVRPQQ